MSKKQIVVIGGGTGTSTVLSGLKKYNDLDLTAVFVVSDSGGSTGRLRDEFGFLPVGDARQCIAALADGEYQEDVKKVLLYRFGKGEGLKGHNLGNLILTALEDIEESGGKAIETAANIFNTKGKVFPITEANIDLVITYADGTVKIGEHNLDDESFGGRKIINIKVSSHAEIYDKAKQAIMNADLVVLGPGDLYGSLLPNTLIKGFKEAISQRKGKFVYIVNLMTHFSQTHEMTAQDHLDEVIDYSGVTPDAVVVNEGKINDKVKKLYADKKDYPVVNDLKKESKFKIVNQNLVEEKFFKQNPNDKLRRSLLRHDRDKLAKLLYQLVK
ncbi:MAG: gluconeogenesis factor YvcK family protein [Patescibacteria group bacterium]|nr:gluconeogenesis factor YvcK family protein [Patescibacteria group bacterium]